MIWRLFRMKTPALSPLAARVLELLQREPEAWKLGAYKLDHRTGVSLWIGNGPQFLRLEDECVVGHAAFTERERKVLWRAIEAWRRARFERILGAGLKPAA